MTGAIALSPGTLIAATLAAIIIGFAKGGLSGVGMLATPILALAIGPVASAAVLLPILISQDAISVWAFRRDWDFTIVAWMLPGALLGVLTGWWLSSALPVSAILAVLGGISICFGLWRLWILRHPAPADDVRPLLPDWLGLAFGWASGFTSHIAHAGGPPFQFWVQPRRLPPVRFAGTTSVLFALINWAKVPAYIALDQFSQDTLLLAAIILPVATILTLIGVRIVHRLRGTTFYAIVNLLLVGVGIWLVREGLAR